MLFLLMNMEITQMPMHSPHSERAETLPLHSACLLLPSPFALLNVVFIILMIFFKYYSMKKCIYSLESLLFSFAYFYASRK